MPRRWFALVLFLTACSASSATTTLVSPQSEAIDSAASTAATSSTDAQPSTTSASGDAAESDVTETGDPLSNNAVAFVAALEEAFAGTSFEGAVLESPELFIATAEVICVRLDNGDQIDQILVDYIDGLSNADGDSDTVSENEAATVAGGVLGASLELFCPQHRTSIEDE